MPRGVYKRKKPTLGDVLVPKNAGPMYNYGPQGIHEDAEKISLRAENARLHTRVRDLEVAFANLYLEKNPPR